LNVMHAVLGTASAAVSPGLHGGDIPMVTCVFGGGVASVPNPKVTPDDNGLTPF
jgi:hypothetical protein